MNTQAKPSRQEFESIKRQLKQDGWTHVLSAMDGDSKDGRTDFGSLFKKDGREFWLNWKTIGDAPVTGEGNAPRVLDCGHEPSPHSDFTTGYGEDSQGKRYCYDCCAERDKTQMRNDGRATLYLSQDNGNFTITNWPGSLKLSPYHVRKGRHNIAGTRYDAWFSFDGQPWHGTQYGENTQLIHCKRIKG